MLQKIIFLSHKVIYLEYMLALLPRIRPTAHTRRARAYGNVPVRHSYRRALRIALPAAMALCLLAVPLSRSAHAHNSEVGHALTLGCDEWPPYQILVNGTMEGFSVEMVHAVLANLRMRDESTTALPWARALKSLRTGRIDALFSINYAREREAYAFFPEEPLTTSKWVIWSRMGDGLAYTGFSDLDGKRVGIVLGYSYTPEFLKYVQEHATAQAVVSDDINFRKLASGRVDFIVAERNNGSYLLRELNLSGIRAHDAHPVKTDALYMAFSRTTIPERFVEEFSHELKRFKTTIAYRELLRKYRIMPARPSSTP